jgi:hypothetical protein
LTKWREEPIQFIAESHCAVESWKNSSLRKEQGEASGIARKNGGAAGLQEGRMQGSRKHGHGECPVPAAETELRQSSNGANAIAGEIRAPLAMEWHASSELHRQQESRFGG